MPYEIEITSVPKRTVAVTRFHVRNGELADVGSKIPAAFKTVMTQLGRSGVLPEAPAVALYERNGDGVYVSAGFPVSDPFEPAGDVDLVVLPAGEVAHTTHHGPYQDLPAAYAALRDTVEAQGRCLAEHLPTWEEYWSGLDLSLKDSRTEVFWPVTN